MSGSHLKTLRLSVSPRGFRPGSAIAQRPLAVTGACSPQTSAALRTGINQANPGEAGTNIRGGTQFATVLRLDQETADLIAAKAVRDAITPDSIEPWNSAESLVRSLYAQGKIEERTASYVLKNLERFALSPAPQFFGAKWYLELNPLTEER